MSAPVFISPMARQIPPAPVLAILSRYGRAEIEGFIEIAIGLLDLTDGDADAEGAHDEDEISTAFFLVGRDGPGCSISDPGGQCSEDEVSTELARAMGDGPGCPIADPDNAVDDMPCDAETEGY